MINANNTTVSGGNGYAKTLNDLGLFGSSLRNTITAELLNA
jgi:hypothetical protein